MKKSHETKSFNHSDVSYDVYISTYYNSNYYSTVLIIILIVQLYLL